MLLLKTRTSDILEMEAGSELLIYDLRLNKAYNLNETSKIVYRACGRLSFDELKRTASLTDETIHFALGELKTNNLIEGEIANHFAGLSRREVIRKVGLASMIALPVITSLIAPVAAHAQSGSNLAFGAACTSSAQCSPSAPNCASRVSGGGTGSRCCIGSDSRFDSGGVVNSCSGGSCNNETFACQGNANSFCCSNSATASCTGNSCTCRCN